MNALGGYLTRIEYSLGESNAAEYPHTIPALQNLESLQLNPGVTLLVGENGTGKSTLLEAIAVTYGFNPEGGSKNFNFSTRSSHSDLHEHLTLVRHRKPPRDGYFLRAESYFNVATNIEELDKAGGYGPALIHYYGGKSLHEQSHGESFMRLLVDRFGGNGLYILDEPEAALSPTRQLAALRRMHELIALDSQFIIATHSPILLAYPGATIYELGAQGIKQTSLEDTAHFQLTKQFLNGPEQMLSHLLRD